MEQTADYFGSELNLSGINRAAGGERLRITTMRYHLPDRQRGSALRDVLTEDSVRGWMLRIVLLAGAAVGGALSAFPVYSWLQ